MAPLKQSNFRIEAEILEGLQFVKDRDGLPIAVQVRRALRAWLDSQGVPKKPAPRRAQTRRKA